MPPDSKELSSGKDKSSSFHRLHTTDFERMKGMYLAFEELRGFDKYKVSSSAHHKSPHKSIAAKLFVAIF